MKKATTRTLTTVAAAAMLIALLAAATASLSLAARYTAFGFDVFAKLNAAEKGNVVISPSSVALALSMTENGAAAKTRSAIAQVLHGSDVSDSQLNAEVATLLDDIPKPTSDVQFSIANSLWVKNGFPIRHSFANEMQRSYRAKVTNIPFNDAGLAQLNGWVKDQTFGLIPKLLDRFDTLDVAVLANALALKAKWLHQFDPHETSPAPFYSASGAPHTISMMRQGTQFEYAKGNQWQLVRLPYRGDRYAMYIFLPAKNSGLAFASAAFERARRELKPMLIELQMPRFTVNYNTNLNGPLSALGMGIAFDPSAANFSRMTSSAVHVSRVEHVTYVRVDEEGTQAAAATAVVTATRAMLPPKEQMIVDHPFYMLLRDDRTDQILFLSRITAPG